MKRIILIVPVLFALTAGAQLAYEGQSAALAQRLDAYKAQAVLHQESTAACGNLNLSTWNTIYIDPDFCRRDREALTWWNQTFAAPLKENQALTMPDISALRMIGQIVTPRTETEEENQLTELTWFRSQGFNGALLVWRGEPPETLAKLAKRLQSDGWMLALTYGPEEQAETRNYVDPGEYREACRQILPYCAFAIPCWRKATFGHMLHFTGSEISARKYRAALTSLIRETNPTIPVMGETTLDTRADYKLISSAHPGTTGSMIFEAAYQDYRIEKVIKFMRTQQLAEPYLFLVIGPRPYYDANTKVHYDQNAVWQYNVQTCATINQNKLAALMLAGGGGGTRELWGTEVSDDLTKTTWRK
jgi:hypothetical protein